MARLKREQDELQLKLTEEMESQLRETRDKLDQEKAEKEREVMIGMAARLFIEIDCKT